MNVFAGGLGNNMSLMEVSLRNNQISEVGAADLGYALNVDPNKNVNSKTRLKHLNLSQNMIADGYTELADLLRDNNKLISLNLSDNMLETPFATQVLLNLQSNYQLQELDLS